jgi:hypothetical protein
MFDSISHWNPGLDNEGATLRDQYLAMPRAQAPSIPWYIKLLENPASPIAFPGAVDIFAHDCIHIVLGRGALAQDEAFVVGFTMGASGRLSRRQQRWFRLWASVVYRGMYRFTPIDRQVFDLGIETAARMNPAPLDRVAFEPLMDRPLGEIRAELGIDRAQLITTYERERARWPTSPASQRLPTSHLADG